MAEAPASFEHQSAGDGGRGRGRGRGGGRAFLK